MKIHNKEIVLSDQVLGSAIVFLIALMLGHMMASSLGLYFGWGFWGGLALGYAYDSTVLTAHYLFRITRLALMTGTELTLIQQTGFVDFLLQQYREKLIDNQLIGAICVVLLLSPIVLFLTKYIVEPIIWAPQSPAITKSPLTIQIIASTIYGILFAVLTKLEVPQYAVAQARHLNLDFHMIVAILVMFILIPLNKYIIASVNKLLEDGHC